MFYFTISKQSPETEYVDIHVENMLIFQFTSDISVLLGQKRKKSGQTRKHKKI